MATLKRPRPRCFIRDSTAVLSRSLLPVFLLLAAAWAAGCASPGAGRQPEQAGAGIAELRKLLIQVRDALEATLNSLDGVMAAADTNPRPAFRRFDESLHRLEVDSFQARARADAMRARGDAYFEEWEEQLQSARDDKAREAATEQKAELRKRFGEIRRTAQRMRDEFKPFLSDLRDLRIVLGNDPSLAGIDAAKPLLLKTTANGRRVQEALGDVLAELNSVAATLQSGKTPKPL